MKDIAIDDVPAFQEAFLDRMRAAHKEDVLQPLAEGKVSEEIAAIIEKEAASVILAMK